MTDVGLITLLGWGSGFILLLAVLAARHARRRWLKFEGFDGHPVWARRDQIYAVWLHVNRDQQGSETSREVRVSGHDFALRVREPLDVVTKRVGI